jgi:hypothetical protein
MQQIQIPPLAEGETYIGSIGNAAGELVHITLLPGDNKGASQKAQLKWAKSIGGDLPNRIEQAMLFAHFPDLFKKEAYWSNQECEWDSGCAWCQSFSSGVQYGNTKGAALRAVAIRRSSI